MNILFSIGSCVLGQVLVARSERGVCAILLGDDAAALARDLRRRFPQAREGGAECGPLIAKVAAFIAQPSMGLDLPLDVQGSEFEQRVWKALQQIPAGSTESYGQVAVRIDAPWAAKEVGEACAANILAVAIPCHRVVHKDGGLAGYRWGIARKRALLRSERAPEAPEADTADLFE